MVSDTCKTMLLTLDSGRKIKKCTYVYSTIHCIFGVPEGRLSGDGVAVLRFPECLLDGLLAVAPGPLACPSRGAWPPSPS